MQLLDLPQEIRLQIYRFVFDNLVSNALYIRKFDADPRWRLCYNPSAQVPGILLVSKNVYSEAIGALQVASLHNPPRIVIDYWRAALHARIMSPEVIEARRGFKVRDLETIRPVLQKIERLNLEVKAIYENEFCLPLIRWLAATLNNRQTVLKHLDASVHVQRYDGDMDRSTVMRELSGIQSTNPFKIWSLRRNRVDVAQGPPQGWLTAVQEVRDSVPFVSEKGAWKDLCFHKSHYWINTMIDENKIIVDPRDKLVTRIYHALSDTWEIWRPGEEDARI